MPENEIYRWAREPRKFLKDFVSHLKAGSVLDLGGSDGGNSMFLAEIGFELTVLDIDERAVDDFLERSSDKKLDTHGIKADMMTFKINDSYDNIITFYALHYLSPERARELIKNIQEKTSQGGANIIVTFTDKGGFEKNRKSFRPTLEELTDLYGLADWDIIHKDTFMGSTRQGVEQERARIIARKR